MSRLNYQQFINSHRVGTSKQQAYYKNFVRCLKNTGLSATGFGSCFPDSHFGAILMKTPRKPQVPSSLTLVFPRIDQNCCSLKNSFQIFPVHRTQRNSLLYC